jgi:hypothetical protein
MGLAIVGSVGYWLIWGPKLRLVNVVDEDGDESLGIIVGGDTVDLDADEEDEDEDNGDGGDNDGL